MDTVLQFITKERDRYTTEDNNRFAFSLYKVTRYWNFLVIINQRYQDLSFAWHNNRKNFENYHKTATKESIEQDMVALENGGKMNIVIVGLFRESESIETGIQLEIESFYLFAKTLLDKLANAVWVYFGRVQKKGCTLRSHDDFDNHFAEYASLKGISISDPDLFELAKALRKEVSDFRDWQISHERNPERGTFSSRMTILDEKGFLKMRVKRFFGENDNEEVSSGKMDELLQKIESFTNKVVELVVKNNNLSTYHLKQ